MQKIFFIVIGRIRTADDDFAALLLGELGHTERGLAHNGEAHFGEVVETVIINDQVVWLLFFKDWFYLFWGFL